MVEQSMKRRSWPWGGGRGGLRMLWKTFLTWEGSGRVVIVTSYGFVSNCRIPFWWFFDNGGGDRVRGLALDVIVESGKEPQKAGTQLRSLIWDMLIM